MKTLTISICLLLIALVNPSDNVLTRFKIPTGFHQVNVQPGSFGAFLQSLPLKPSGAHTLTYKGAVAATDAETAAVVDSSSGHEDLQQCADAVMRLRGEYLWDAGRYKEIAFHFVNGFKCDYVHYADGYRYHNDKWILRARKDYGYNTFIQYMQLVFAYAGTLSLEKELKPVTKPDELKAGDVFIHGGSPGHCFIVMDVVENDRHEKQFLLAQSFMPPQNKQVQQTAPGYEWFNMDKIPSIWYGELVK